MNLNPQWILGFVDGEGCFWVGTVNVRSKPSKTYPEGFITKQIQIRFTISQHKKSINVLYGIKRYFKCGRVQSNKGKESMKNNPIYDYRVNNIDHLMGKIVPFFEKYSLLTKKRRDFLFFRKFVLRLSNKEHLMVSPETGRLVWDPSKIKKWEKEIQNFRKKL